MGLKDWTNLGRAAEVDIDSALGRRGRSIPQSLRDEDELLMMMVMLGIIAMVRLCWLERTLIVET